MRDGLTGFCITDTELPFIIACGACGSTGVLASTLKEDGMVAPSNATSSISSVAGSRVSSSVIMASLISLLKISVCPGSKLCLFQLSVCTHRANLQLSMPLWGHNWISEYKEGGTEGVQHSQCYNQLLCISLTLNWNQ